MCKTFLKHKKERKNSEWRHWLHICNQTLHLYNAPNKAKRLLLISFLKNLKSFAHDSYKYSIETKKRKVSFAFEINLEIQILHSDLLKASLDAYKQICPSAKWFPCPSFSYTCLRLGNKKPPVMIDTQVLSSFITQIIFTFKQWHQWLTQCQHPSLK